MHTPIVPKTKHSGNQKGLADSASPFYSVIATYRVAPEYAIARTASHAVAVWGVRLKIAS